MRTYKTILALLLIPVLGSGNEIVDLDAALDDAKETPNIYHAMCAAAYALLAADATDRYQAQLDTYAVEHMKKTSTAEAALMVSIYEEMLETKRISPSDLEVLTHKCEL